VIDGLERLTRIVNRAFVLIASVLVLAIVAAILREVVFRYAFNAPSIWALDGARFTLLFVFFLALAPALESGHHVHVDLFDPVIPAPLRWYLRIIGYTLTLLFGAVLFHYVLDTTIDAFETDELSFSVVPVKLKYVYWIGPIGVLQFVLTAFVQLVRCWQERTPRENATAAPLAGH
jgi:TRAP-type C4-dicarboxylate transport system permease small subunit